MSDTVTILICDLAEQLSAAEDVGFARALDTLQVSDRQRFEMMMEHRAMHGLRKKLYVAQLSTPRQVA